MMASTNVVDILIPAAGAESSYREQHLVSNTTPTKTTQLSTPASQQQQKQSSSSSTVHLATASLGHNSSTTSSSSSSGDSQKTTIQSEQQGIQSPKLPMAGTNQNNSGININSSSQSKKNATTTNTSSSSSSSGSGNTTHRQSLKEKSADPVHHIAASGASPTILGGGGTTNALLETAAGRRTSNSVTPANNTRNTTSNNTSSKPCCFCWCCCYRCTCLSSRNQEEELSKSKDITSRDSWSNDPEVTPSVEEIRCWGDSFDRLMKSPMGRAVFREFLKCEYSEENILFWLACEDLKKDNNPEVVEEKARLIYEDYISILSPKEVSLDSRVREIVNRNMVDPTPHTFDEAQLQIYTLMHRDSYPRFVNSAYYKKLAQLSSTSRKESSA
nr:EOG090X0IBZ [Simocephalus serrulatus]